MEVKVKVSVKVLVGVWVGVVWIRDSKGKGLVRV